MGRITKYKTNLNIFLGKTDAHMLRNDLFAAIHPSGIAHFIKELCCAKEENLNLLIILLIKALVKSLGHFFLPWATIAEIIGSILAAFSACKVACSKTLFTVAFQVCPNLHFQDNFLWLPAR